MDDNVNYIGGSTIVPPKPHPAQPIDQEKV